MTLDEIAEEYRRNGRLGEKWMNDLRTLVAQGDDPYSAITLAGDTRALQLADAIAPHLDHEDSMVRWNAAAVLFTRFCDDRFADACLRLLHEETDNIVRGVALAGAGELIPILEGGRTKQLMANELLRVMKSEDELPGIRSAAYSGIEAAVGIPPLARAPAYRALDMQDDVSLEVIEEFRMKYLGLAR